MGNWRSNVKSQKTKLRRQETEVMTKRLQMTNDE